MKVAIVHEWLANMGGSEKVTYILHELFPEAPIFTCVHNKKRMPEEFNKLDIHTTFIQKLPFGKTKYQAYLPLMPIAFEQLDLTEYDLVISSSTSCAKGVITRADTLHICYCHTPMRYAWDFYFEYTKDKNWAARVIIAKLMHKIRQWDRIAADRVDYFISNSNNVAKRIKKHYRKDAKVVYAPVDTNFYTPGNEDGNYYLIVSRLVGYKRVDLAIEAFNELGFPLIVIGNGSEYKKYKKMAKRNITFLGRLSDEEVRDYYRGCKALIFPGEEDFGLTPIEAQACGRPVIAYGKGGTLETIIEESTGVFFYEQSVQALKEAVFKFENNEKNFDKRLIREHATEFSIDGFKTNIMKFINEKVDEFKKGAY